MSSICWSQSSACAKTIITFGVSYFISIRLWFGFVSSSFHTAIITSTHCLLSLSSFTLVVVHTFFMHFNILEFFDNILDPNNFHVYVPVDERETEDDKIKPRKHFSGIFINSSSINIENVKKVHHQSLQKISWSSHGRMRFSL